MSKFSIRFRPSGRGKAQNPPDPRYPNGSTFDMSRRSLTVTSAEAPYGYCRVELPYPAPECGHYDIRCSECGISVAISAAGRPDDPKAAIVTCHHSIVEWFRDANSSTKHSL